MYRRISKILIVSAVSLGLLACAIAGSKLEKRLVSEGAVRLNSAQVTNHLSGNTQVWTTPGSGAYFQPDGSVHVKYEGRIYPLRTWTVDDDGKVCIAFPNGFVSSCSVYYYKDDTVWYVTLEIMGIPQETDGGPDTIVEGNRLSSIEI